MSERHISSMSADCNSDIHGVNAAVIKKQFVVSIQIMINTMFVSVLRIIIRNAEHVLADYLKQV